jgi:hypothetical protein
MTPWFKTEIITGLQKLQTLCLDNAPAEDTIPGTAMAWIESLTHGRFWDQERDTPRIREAFARLPLHTSRWPSPAQLLELMPATKPQRALTHDRGIPQSREERSARLIGILGELYNPATADPDYDPHEAHRRAQREEAEREIARMHNPPSEDEE